jgi:hypothetical protein
MTEFKFSCPGCGQHIACDVGYAGAQINCPTCKQAIVVPQAPSVAPAIPPAPARLAGRVAPPPPVPPMPERAGAAAPPPKKSGALKMVSIVAVVLVCAAVGFFGVQFALHHLGGGKPKGNPAAQVAAPTANEAVQALSILSKVYSAYTNVTTVKAEGTLTLYLDLSNLTAADLNPGMPADSPNAKRHPRGVPRVVTNTTDIYIRQAPSNFYYFAGEAISKVDRQTITNTFAYWSSDRGRYMFNDSHLPRVPATYMQLPDVKTGNAADQFKQMQHLFQDPANLTKIIKDLGQTEDETVNDEDCYTLTAKVFGQKVKIWVDKSSYLVPQWQITLGGLVSDADIDDAFSLFAAGMTNVPSMQMNMVEMQVKKMTPALAKISGTITSTTDSIEVNPALVSADFDYDVPPGVRLMKLSNMAAQGRPPN